MSKQSAVEWFYEQLEFDESILKNDINQVYKKAKEMFEQQIIDAHCQGGIDIDNYKRSANEYFNDTYKGGENV